MGIYLKKGNWFIDYYAEGRRKREKIGTSKSLADTVLKKRKVEIAEGKFLDINREQKIKFEEFADEYLELHSKLKKSYYTDCKIVGLLKKQFSGRYLYEIASLDIEKFKSKRIKEVSPATVNRALAVLKSMFNRAIVWKKAKENPCKAVKLFKENNQRLRFLEREEIEKLLNNCSEHLKPIVIVALNTGMRKGEILNMKWHDIDIKRSIIHILDTKNGEKKEMPMNDIVKKALIAVPKNPESSYVFCNKYGIPYGDVRKSFFTALKKAGIIDFHFHDLRHTFASQLVMSGVDLNTVRELLGHKSLEMTLRYSHLSPDHKQRAVDILGQRMDTFWTLGGGTNLPHRYNNYVTATLNFPENFLKGRSWTETPTHTPPLLILCIHISLSSYAHNKILKRGRGGNTEKIYPKTQYRYLNFFNFQNPR